MIQVSEEFLVGDNDFDMPSGSVHLFFEDIVFAPGHGIRFRNDVHAGTGANGVITVGIDL